MENQATNDLTVEELSEKEIEAVEKFHRQLSSPSILEDGTVLQDYNKTLQNITQEEVILMKNVLRAFGLNQESVIIEKETGDSVIIEKETGDSVDGSSDRYLRLTSSESYENYTYRSDLSPGRLYVRVTKEAKNIFNEVHEKILHMKPGLGVHRNIKREIEVNLVNSFPPDSLHPNDIDVTLAVERTLENPNLYPNNNSGSNFHDSGIPTPSNARNGHVGYSSLSRLPPKERFQELTRKYVRRKKEEFRDKKREYERRLWEKRGKAGWLDLIFTSFGLLAFFLDTGTDLKVAIDHFATGHPWWGTFTLILVFFPTVLVNVVSYFFYKEDEERDHGPSPGSGWKAVKITHLIQVGLLERYWRILVKAYKIKFKKIQETTHYQLYIAMNLDVAMLQLILAFTEDAPQLVLQLYVLIRRHLVETLQTSRFQDLWTIASIILSFISYSRAVVNYIACLRNSKKDKGVLRWYGYIAMWFWRALMFISRVLVLVFFASEFTIWFFIIFLIHFFLVLVLMKGQKVCFFPDHKGMQAFMRFVIAYIHTFCFFVLDASQRVRWAVIYYCLTALEAIIFSSLWFTNAFREISLELELGGLAVIFISYVLGLLMMIVYYKFLHPKFKRPQTKWHAKAPPKEELCEEAENAEDEESESDGEALSVTGGVEQTHHLVRNKPSKYRQIQVWV